MMTEQVRAGPAVHAHLTEDDKIVVFRNNWKVLRRLPSHVQRHMVRKPDVSAKSSALPPLLGGVHLGNLKLFEHHLSVSFLIKHRLQPEAHNVSKAECKDKSMVADNHTVEI